jgi:hypothetical protein
MSTSIPIFSAEGRTYTISLQKCKPSDMALNKKSEMSTREMNGSPGLLEHGLVLNLPTRSYRGMYRRRQAIKERPVIVL